MNAFETVAWIAKEAVAHLSNNCVFANLVHRSYETEFKHAFKTGDEVTIREPTQYTAVAGETMSPEDINESSLTLKVDQRYNIGMQISSKELALDHGKERVTNEDIKSACGTMANKVDEFLAGLYTGFYNTTGTPGSTPASFQALTGGPELLDHNGVPQDGRHSVVDPTAHWKLADALKGVYQPTLVKEVLRQSTLGRYANTDFFMDQNVATHAAGAQGGTPVVNGASQTGSSLVIDGASNSITGWILKGDVFTIAGVYAVNPMSKATRADLQQFVATADAASDGAGNVTIAISPPITASGSYQTVSGSPADNVAITFKTGAGGALSKQNLVFRKNAMALVMVDLPQPEGAHAAKTISQDGFSIRCVQDYNITNDKSLYRLDIFFGGKVIDPRQGVRLFG